MDIDVTTSQTPLADHDELSICSSDFVIILQDLAGLDGWQLVEAETLEIKHKARSRPKRFIRGRCQCNKFLSGTQRIMVQVKLMQRTKTHYSF